VREDKYAVVVTRDGNYYVGEFEKEGGECKIISHRALVKE
jgi:hypothetical protein